MNIWQKMQKPILILAPMEDVTDTVFRQIVVSCAKPDLFFTEFTSASGLLSQGSKEVCKRLNYTEAEKPIIAQFWGNVPSDFYKAAKILSKMGFDGIDINMGCPKKAVIKKGCGAALIENPSLAKKIIEATKKGAGRLPVSVKTRIGLKDIKTEEWIRLLLRTNIAAITIHARTAKMQSKGLPMWEEIKKAADIRNSLKSKTLIIGNGDVKSRKEALEKVKRYCVDGVMIGRAIFTNPFLFDGKTCYEKIPLHEKMELLKKHLKLFKKTYANPKNITTMKKYFKIYVNNFPDASDLRIKIMEKNSPQEVIKEINLFLRK